MASNRISRRSFQRARPGWSKRNHARNSRRVTGSLLMAKAATKSPKAKKKAPKAAKAVTKVSPKADKKGKAGGGKSRSAGDTLWKLAEHPLIGELIAVGATAAVAAI